MELRWHVKSAVPKDEPVIQLGSWPGSAEGNGHASPEQESQAESLETTILHKKHSSDNYTLYLKENSVASTELGTAARLWLGPGKGVGHGSYQGILEAVLGGTQGFLVSEPWLGRGLVHPGWSSTPGGSHSHCWPGPRWRGHASPSHVSRSDGGQGRQGRCSDVQLTPGLHLSLLTKAQFGNLGSRKWLRFCNQ